MPSHGSSKAHRVAKKRGRSPATWPTMVEQKATIRTGEEIGDVSVEAGTEALVLVDMEAELAPAFVSAPWAMDDEGQGLAEKLLLAASEQVRPRE
jgi:hypothetical protein